MNMSGSFPEGAQTKSRPIVEAVKAVERELARLSKLVNGLEMQLSSMLTPMPPAPGEALQSSTPPPSHPLFSQHLFAIANQVARLAEVASSIINRLEL